MLEMWEESAPMKILVQMPPQPVRVEIEHLSLGQLTYTGCPATAFMQSLNASYK